MATKIKLESARLPHYEVYTRLACSSIHGVGVQAIRDIKKGTYIFFGDDEKLVWVHASELKALPDEVKKLYADFAVKKGDLYGCPVNFNQLTLAWYLNHSDDPNVAADDEYRFYALRNIKKGEELTVNYNTYSDMQDRGLS